MSRYRLYLTTGLASLGGYAWLWINHSRYSESPSGIGMCFFKEITHLPCPSCGTTRSVLSITKGDIFEAILWNPFGIIISVAMLTIPVWLTFDLITNQSSFHRFYQRFEDIFKKKQIAIPAILLVIANWIWNIVKNY